MESTRFTDALDEAVSARRAHAAAARGYACAYLSASAAELDALAAHGYQATSAAIREAYALVCAAHERCERAERELRAVRRALGEKNPGARP